MRARRQTARSRDEANEPQGAPPSRPVRPRRHAPVAVPLVVLSLVALAALAVVVDQQMGRIEAVLLEHGAPARTAVHDIQVGLALETAGTRGYLLTGDTIYASAHQEARQRRREATARLGGVAGGMDDDIDALIASLKERLVPADAALDSLFAGLIPRQDYRARLPAQQGRLEAVTTTVTAIGDAVNDHMYARFRDVRRGGRISLMLTLLLVAATMAAGTQVARLGLSYRRLAVTEHAAREASEAAREEAERSKAALERIAESRARLIRGFTHDVKNPLGAAAAYLGLLEMGAMTPDDAIQRVRRTLDSALKLIDDSLLVARAEKGELEVHREPFDLGAIARQAVEDARALARAKRLDLHAEIPDTLPFLNSDPRRVRQVLDNLISNAIKYTDSGGVTVRVQMAPDGSPAAAEARVEVADTGPGLNSIERERVFDEFERLGTHHHVPGTGLGLAISQLVAGRLGGTLVVESTVGVGSTFALVLPGAWVAPPADGPDVRG